MNNRAKTARNIFDNGFNCAQSVLATFSEPMGVSHRDALRIAGAFGAGMGRMGNVCGAVTGAFMVIGLNHAKTREDENEERAEAYRLVQQFTAKFEEMHGTIECRNLLGIDLTTDEGIQTAQAQGLFESKCARFVEDAVLILESLLDEKRSPTGSK